MTRLPGWKPEVSAIQLAESGRDAGQLRSRLVELRDPLEALQQQRLDVSEVTRHALLCEGEDELLGPVDEVVGLPVRSCPRRVISWPRVARPRSVAISLTMRA